MKKCIFLISIFWICVINQIQAQQIQGIKSESNSDQNVKRTEWFQEARFGMFIHFGLYSIPAGVWDGKISGRNMYAEWIQKQGNWPYGIPDTEYRALAKQFNPTKFNAEEWVLEAKNAGMKYIIITAKHHDGFALWPSKFSSFNVVEATPFKRDILGELAQACKKFQMKLGFYYSHWQDWENEGGAKPLADQFKSIPPPVQVTDIQFENYWKKKCLPQVKELIENYHPALLWFDTWGKPEVITDKRLDELISLVRNLDPNCLINSRILMTHPDIAQKVDFLSMGDNVFPTTMFNQPWETSGTMNYSWGYHQLDYHWETTKSLLSKLIGNVSRNGNFQLNIGPMADGTFPKASIRRLREMGAWFFVNGEAVYNAKPTELNDANLIWGFITKSSLDTNNSKLYLYVTKWPDNRELEIKGIDILPSKVSILETGQQLNFIPYPQGGITIQLPFEPVDSNITVIEIDLNK
jgi:alpha-L-fucosidase